LVRVRFAPSPTGYLHIGGARTALFNWLFARKNNGKFILRIEDTDKERSTEESVKVILDSLKWMGLDWDEGPGKDGEFGPYFQSQREGVYTEYIEQLLDEGKAYPCYCTKEELDAEREQAKKEKRPYKYSGKCRNAGEKDKPYTVRLRVEQEGETVVKDLIRGDVSFKNEVLDDFIIARADASPIYNFVVAVDDALMKITHVIRGEDHLSNTPKQAQVYKALGFPVPEFAHIPLILGPDKSRLSKRHGATSVGEYEKMGILPDAFVNALALLGWAYDDKTEKFSREELIKYFDLSRVHKSGAMYDINKMYHFNGIYIREMDIDKLVELCVPYLKETGFIDDKTDPEYIKHIVSLEQEKLKTLSEIAESTVYFFKEVEADEKAAKVLEKNKDNLVKILELLKAAINKTVNKEEIEKEIRENMEKEGIKPKAYMHVARAVLSGRTTGPGLFDIIETLGKSTCLKRIGKHI